MVKEHSSYLVAQHFLHRPMQWSRVEAPGTMTWAANSVDQNSSLLS